MGVPGSPHGRRILYVFAALSALTHAALFALAPGFVRETEPARSVLQVSIRQPEPLPATAPAAEPAPAARAAAPRPGAGSGPAITAARPAQPGPQVRSPPVAPPAFPAETAAVAAAAAPAEPPAPAQPERAPQAAASTVPPPAINARYLRNPAPRYPPAARRSGEQGTVTLRVLVSPDGAPARVDIEKTSGSPHLDNAALEAVKGWRFSPARRGAEPVEGWVLVPIVFRLEG
ncbi:MAG: energy transducer TonB [Burkholderiales bacterium]|nr:energy transducer TonB [Burkholderiales bacterium]